MALYNEHPDSNVPSLKLLLNEIIADICSILSNDNNSDLTKLAIYHYELTIDKSLISQNEKNIKICLSILGCYESLISTAYGTKNKISYCTYRDDSVISRQPSTDIYI